MSAKPNAASRAVNLRIREDVRDLIDHAARAHSKTRSEFMIEAARRAAEDTLLDQTLMLVDPTTYAHFLKVLDQSPASDGFARLMAAPQPWKS